MTLLNDWDFAVKEVEAGTTGRSRLMVFKGMRWRNKTEITYQLPALLVRLISTLFVLKGEATDTKSTRGGSGWVAT